MSRTRASERSRWWSGGLALLVCSLALAPTAVQGQSLTVGDVELTIVDERGRPVRDAIATVVNDGTTLTGRQEVGGSIDFHGLLPGLLQIRAEALGYRPAVLTGVRAHPGRRQSIRVRLNTGEPPFDRVDTLAWRPDPDSERGTTRLVRSDLLDHLVDPTRDGSGLAGVAPGLDPVLGFEGLPGSMTRTLVDGVPVGRPEDRNGASSLVPRIGLRNVGVLAVGADSEVPGLVSGALLESTGGQEARGSAYAALLPAAAIDGVADGSAVGQGISAGALGRSALSSGFRLSAGIEYLRLDLPRVGIQGLSPAQIPTPSGPLDFAELGRDGIQSIENINGFGRLDWSNQTTTVRVTGGARQASNGPDGAGFLGERYAARGARDGVAVFGSGSVKFRLGANQYFEFKVGVDRDEQAPDAGLGEIDFDLPGTYLTETAARMGQGQGSGGASTSRGFFLSPQASGLSPGGVVWKMGAQLESRSYEFQNDQFSRSTFVFSGVDQLAAGVGGLQSGATVAPNAFRITTGGGFAQAVIPVGVRANMTIGGRVDYTRLPFQDYQVDSRLIDDTGLAPVAKDNWVGAGGNVKLTYDLNQDGSSELFASAALGQGLIDAAGVNEVLSLAGGQSIQRATGSLGTWPVAQPVGPRIAPQFTLLGADYRPPRTARTQLGVVNRVGSLELGAWVTARRTDFLLRRRDLNRRSQPISASGQQGEVFGVLEQYGSAVLVRPGSDRRFAAFDRIWTLDPDGQSEYVGATVEVAYDGSSAWLTAAYTFSRTRDNWFGGRSQLSEARLIPTVLDPNSRAISDFDLPHSALAHGGVRFPIPGGLSVGGSYRLRSGFPFTPAYRTGVDLNGDGSGFNDVPLLDPAFGAEALGWDCVSATTLRPAIRNDCRAPAVHQADLVISTGIPGAPGVRLQLGVANVISSEWGQFDEAVYLVDESGSGPLSLQLNPGFGTLITPLTAPRIFRMGLSLAF